MALSFAFLQKYLAGEQARTADDRGFADEAVTHLTALYNFALWMSRDADMASDLVQETYLRALRFQHRFQPGTNMRAWMFKILRNAFLDMRTGGARYVEMPEEVDGKAVALDPRGAGFVRREDHPEERLDRLDLSQALTELPDPFRTAVVLSDLEGLNTQEIAEIMGCPPNTVKTRLFRGRRMLREMLTGYREEVKAP